ncbi:hrp65 protein isoform X3 [Chironomus tepperi]|uniref:hrp65 protein isoform X3 n=1 Tax=Chironomus tepperi TaxID=113505 RepID=UPI00391F27C1
MEVKAETANGPAPVKNENQNQPKPQRENMNNKNQNQNQNNNMGGGPNRRNMNMNKNFQNRGGKGGPGGNHMGNRGPMKNEDYIVNSKLKNLAGPTHDLPELVCEEIKFSGRNRLYIGNLTSDVTEEELKELFSPYGEISEAFINAEKNFAFLKIDYRANAERAKKDLDGRMRKNKPIRIRFAPNATTIRVKNLTPFVSNELLFKSFEVFGQVERAVIIVDDRGKTTGEGIVEFARKSGAMSALKYCSEKCFFLTSSLRPCVVETFDHIDETDGFPEKSLMRKSNDYYKARQNGPRFAEMGSFEHEFGTKWKQMYDMYKQKHDALKREMQLEEEKLEAQMEYAKFEHETESLREQLRKREQDRDRQKKEWEDRERQADESRVRDEQQMRRQTDDMQMRMQRQDEEMRRRQQENSLFMQAQQLSNMLDQQEMNQGGSGNGGNNGGNNQGGGGGNQGGGRRNFNNDRNNDRNQNFDMMNQGSSGNHGGNQYQGNQHYQGNQDQGNRFDGPPQRGNVRPWNNNDRGHRDDFQNKRRRY